MMAAMVAMTVAGCGGLGERTWIAQGPGDSAEVLRAKREAQKPVAPLARTAQAAAPRSAAMDSPAPGAESGAYTQATRYGDLLFVSGQIAIDHATAQFTEGSIEAQTRKVMDNIRSIVEAHRLTMANVVSVTVYMKDMNRDFRGMDEVYESYFRSNLPSRSVVEVSRLPRGALVEITVIAGR
jgi:2-iminobutanoate/2-iminopropanoate deaminase